MAPLGAGRKSGERNGDASVRGRRRVTLIEYLSLVGIIALVIAILLPSLQRLRLNARRDPCSSNMRVIGQALLLYSVDHGGRYPQRLEELLGYDWSPSPERFRCGISGKPVIFVGLGAVASDLTADDVVAHEQPSGHDGEGSNVLYGDGHVAWLTSDQLERELGLSTTRAATRPAR